MGTPNRSAGVAILGTAHGDRREKLIISEENKPIPSQSGSPQRHSLDLESWRRCASPGFPGGSKLLKLFLRGLGAALGRTEAEDLGRDVVLHRGLQALPAWYSIDFKDVVATIQTGEDIDPGDGGADRCGSGPS
jgi:hypothetical protein